MAETLRELVVALSLDSSKVFILISLRKQQIAKLDELVKARFVEMFGDPVKNPKKWATKCFDDVCDGIGDGLHGTPEYDDNGDYPFINGNNLIDGHIVITPATKKVSADTYKQHFIEIPSNAILISINGTLGKLAYYNDEKVMLGKGRVSLLAHKKHKSEAAFTQLLIYGSCRNARIMERVASFCSGVRTIQLSNTSSSSGVTSIILPSAKNCASVIPKAVHIASRVGMEGIVLRE